jgi:hypothetical protein
MTSMTLALPLSIALLAGAASAPSAPPAAPPAGKAPETARPADPSAANPAGPVSEPPRDFETAPPGASPADQALWRSAYDVNNDLVVEQYAAARLTHQAKRSGYETRIPALAKSGALPQPRADDLLKRLRERWMANLELMQAQWPVSKVRVCRYELLNFEGVLPSDDNPRRKGQIEEARATLAPCVDKATAVLRAVRAANEGLRSVLAEIDRELAPYPASPAAATAGGPAAPAPEAATGAAPPKQN